MLLRGLGVLLFGDDYYDGWKERKWELGIRAK